MQRFTKVRDTGKAVLLRWTTEEQQGKGHHHHELTSEARPHPDFVAALQIFKPFVAQLIDAPPAYLEEARVVSVSVSRKGDVRGVMIHATRPVSKATAPFNIHTPHVKELAGSEEEETDEPGDGAVGVWLPGMEDALDELEAQAVAFINGKREQGDLFEQPVEAHRNGSQRAVATGA